jgi:hypothetical protein
MRSSEVRGQPFFRVTFLLYIFFAGYLGTGESVKARTAPPQKPESFRQLEASVVSLKFFATETAKAAPMPLRAYNTDFIRADTHYIWWQLQLHAKAERDKPVRMLIKAVWQRPDGTEFRQSQTVTIPADSQYPCLAAGWGSTQQGTWLPGTYRVTILVDDVPVVRGEIEVFEKLLKGH